MTEHPDELDWDGFRSLYRGHLGPVKDTPRICEDEPSMARRRLDASFLCDKDRAHQYFIDIRIAKEEFTLACLSHLTRGNYPTLYDLLISFSHLDY